MFEMEHLCQGNELACVFWSVLNLFQGNGPTSKVSMPSINACHQLSVHTRLRNQVATSPKMAKVVKNRFSSLGYRYILLSKYMISVQFPTVITLYREVLDRFPSPLGRLLVPKRGIISPPIEIVDQGKHQPKIAKKSKSAKMI